MRDLRKYRFRFKQFSCFHGKSAMKIGVDAVLLGAWADVSGSTILDVGTGCGVIALMCAQRNLKASVFAIDIDGPSVDEATLNFANSPWSDRLKATLQDFANNTLSNIDLIISNPPYFDSGVSMPDSPRMIARHQSGLSPAVLIEHGSELLSDSGRIAMIVPDGQERSLMESANSKGLCLSRICSVKGHHDAPVKRVLLEFSKDRTYTNPCRETLVLEHSPGMPTDEHIRLCRDFYLKF